MAETKKKSAAGAKKATGTKPKAAKEAPAAEKKAAPETPKKIEPKLKPELDAATKEALEQRSALKKRTPHFQREEWFRYKKLSRSGWRRPDGITSKMRRHFKYRPNVVSIGFGSPVKARGLHPSGFEEVPVFNVNDLDQIDPKKQAARIGGSVGAKKRESIQTEAAKRNIRILNPMHAGGGSE
jgi:large subunit ribosomal protein L32e